MRMETGEPKQVSPSTGTRSRKTASSDPNCLASWRHLRAFLVFAALLTVLFFQSLVHLVAFALHSDLYSYVLLIPLISVYFIWTKREVVVPESQPNRQISLVAFLIGAGLIFSYWLALRKNWGFSEPDGLAITTFSFLCLMLGGALAFIKINSLKSIAFPIGFLFLSIPFPEAMRHAIERFFQVSSAQAAYWMLELANMPVFKTGTHFQLPGFSIEVAPECSGIHSSLVLFITSLLAAYLFLKKPPCGVWFALSTIPLAILRNGFRIFTISQLCVQVSPQMINSPIHHRGGPLFFVLSLVPLFLLLLYLIKREKQIGVR